MKATVAILCTFSAVCAAMSDGKPAPSLDGTSWVLASLPGKTLVKDSLATLQLQGGRANGSDGCNRYTGTYQTDGARIAIPAPAGTLMACTTAVQQQAQWYRSALGSARTWRMADNSLLLLDEHGGELATLVAQSYTLAGSSWSATGINNGTGAVATPPTGTTVTLNFGADGTVSGSTGCNAYTGRYQNTVGKVEFPNVFTSTRRMCVGTGVMEQEQAFLQALGASTTVRIEAGRLELRDAGGALQISASRT